MTIFSSLFFLAREVFNAAVVSRADGFFRGLSDGAEVLAEREAQEEVAEPTLPLWPESEAPLMDASTRGHWAVPTLEELAVQVQELQLDLATVLQDGVEGARGQYKIRIRNGFPDYGYGEPVGKPQDAYELVLAQARAQAAANGIQYQQAAWSGGRTQLRRVIDLINQGHTTESIRAWCAKEIERTTNTSAAPETPAHTTTSDDVATESPAGSEIRAHNPAGHLTPREAHSQALTRAMDQDRK